MSLDLGFMQRRQCGFNASQAQGGFPVHYDAEVRNLVPWAPLIL